MLVEEAGSVGAVGRGVLLAATEDTRILAKPVFPDWSWAPCQLSLDSAHCRRGSCRGGRCLFLTAETGMKKSWLSHLSPKVYISYYT